jgi:uncharacterized membrane protein YdjX (TVP38/TMEM64 family)
MVHLKGTEEPVLNVVQKRPTRATSAATIALAVGLLGVLVAWAIWSYRTSGLMHVLIAAAPEGQSRLDVLRTYILGYGPLAPIVYVSAVIVEVLVAPIPGPILYAPAGAIFGGLIGGTLSLIGNVTGAGIACWIGRALGESWVARHTSAQAARIRERVVARGPWVIFLLRINPLTSSDLVSYVAGAMGVPVRHVVLGTLAGMAPLCFAQAYLAASLFEILPGGPIIVLVLGAAYLAVVVWFLLTRRRSP